MRILVTGHTGFKGSWLAFMLQELGHEVHGVALTPLANGIFERAKIHEICTSDYRTDIRDKRSLDSIFLEVQPEVVFHLAAQPLVLSSYDLLFDTYSTNLMGTLNVLDASILSNQLKCIVVVTTDKVYMNNEEQRPFTEDNPLGGKDPYSSSKALSDLLTQDWSTFHPKVPVGVARAGNVIGGGDVSPNRLIPDLLAALELGKNPILRNPKSIRPWQHVMDCLSGYIALMQHLLKGEAGIFNFGPSNDIPHTVQDVAEYLLSTLGGKDWSLNSTPTTLKESKFLMLDSKKAHSVLGWKNKLGFIEGLNLTIEWEIASRKSVDMSEFTRQQIKTFMSS